MYYVINNFSIYRSVLQKHTMMCKGCYSYQWRIYIQKFPARGPHNRTKFFHFNICFHRKAPASEVGTPSNEGWRPPMGNPGSTPAYVHNANDMNLHLTKCFIKEIQNSIKCSSVENYLYCFNCKNITTVHNNKKRKFNDV